jgi:Ca2+-binding EF-hand superfamily protein
LAEGTITSARCFHHVEPVPTPRVARNAPRPEFGQITLIPDGFKIAVEFRSCIYIGETRYNGLAGGITEYRFTRQEDESLPIEVSDWHTRPGGAFNQVCITGESSEKRPNGKMYIGVFYSGPQQYLREAFANYNVAQFRADDGSREVFNAWQGSAMAVSPSTFSVSSGSSPIGSVSSVPVFASSLSSAPTIGTKRLSAGEDPNIGLPPRGTASAMNNIDAGQQDLANIAKQARIEVMRWARESSDPRIQVGASANATPSRPPTSMSTISNAVASGDDSGTNMITRAMRKLLNSDSVSSIFQSDSSLAISRQELSAIGMSPKDLFHALKNPNSETLTRNELKRAMGLLLQMPIPTELVDATFNACDVDRTRRVTLENFMRAMEEREHDLYAQFSAIDSDHSGDITLDELRRARENGAFHAQERELDALLIAMDRASENFSDNSEHAYDRKIQWAEFRAMMILLPPATTIQTIVDLVRRSLDEQDELRAFDDDDLVLDKIDVESEEVKRVIGQTAGIILNEAPPSFPAQQSFLFDSEFPLLFTEVPSGSFPL